MKFIKGMVVGGMISAGIMMMCYDNMSDSKRKMIKKGRQFARKMGMM